MKKLSIVQVILILLLIAVIIFGFFITKKKTNTWEIHKTDIQTTQFDTVASLYETEQKQLQVKMDAYAAYNDAVNVWDVTVCEKITSDDKLKTECVDNVYSAKASKEKNVTMCGKIQDTTTKNRCTNSFSYDTAIVSGQQSDCDKIIGNDDLKNACAKNIVFTKIESQSFSGNTDICSGLTAADLDYCTNRIKKSADIDLLQKGTTTKNISICAQIKDSNMRNTCSDTVYLTLAIEKQDESICAKITDSTRKTNCTTPFARIHDANTLSQALKENNAALCTTISAKDISTKCTDTLLLKAGVANKDATTCAKISDTGTRKQCSDAVKLILDQINKQK